MADMADRADRADRAERAGKSEIMNDPLTGPQHQLLEDAIASKKERMLFGLLKRNILTNKGKVYQMQEKPKMLKNKRKDVNHDAK